MNNSLLIRLGLSVSLFIIGWNLEAGTLSFIIFSIASCILIYPFVLNKSKEDASIDNNDYLYDLSNEIHKKFHATCDVLEKIKSPIDKKDLVTFLESKGVSCDKHSSYDNREINLDVGKNIYRYIPAAKTSVNMGKVEGVIYLKKGQNKGTNYKRPAEETGHYVLMNDTGDIKNLIPVFPDKTISFK